MKISAIPADGVVVVDGVARKVDLAGILADNINAVQWDDANGGGEIEYTKPRRNESTKLTVMRDALVQAWTAAAPPEPPPVDQKAVDEAQSMRYLLRKLIAAEARQADAPDYLKRTAAEYAKG